MCLFDEDDLYDINRYKELFARFNLLERERKILTLHILKSLKFELIAGVERVFFSACVPGVQKKPEKNEKADGLYSGERDQDKKCGIADML